MAPTLMTDPTAPSYQQCPVCRQPMKVTPGELPLVSCEGCQVLGTWPPPSVDDSSSEIFELSYAGERRSRRKQWIYEARRGWRGSRLGGGWGSSGNRVRYRRVRRRGHSRWL